MGTLLISIDPGRTTGYAVFSGGVLAAAGIFRPLEEPLPATLAHAAPGTPVVVEMPVDRGLDRVPPGDLIALAFRLGLVVGDLRARGCLWPAREVFPAQWKGQVNKPVVHARLRTIVTPNELSIMASLNHDALDAVGLGLWTLGRYRVR